MTMPRLSLGRLYRPSTGAGRLSLIVYLCLASPIWAESPIRLRDVTDRTGIQFEHSDGSTGKRYVVEPVASGLATFDYDGDGLIDIYFLTGGPLEGKQVENPPTNALYRNLGDFRFVDETQATGVGIAGFAMGVAVADYDNDGRADIYVSNYGPNVLYHQQGDGTFVDATEAAGVRLKDKVGVGAGVAFLDIDEDGSLDLYVANYLRFSSEDHPGVRLWASTSTPGHSNSHPSPTTSSATTAMALLST